MVGAEDVIVFLRRLARVVRRITRKCRGTVKAPVSPSLAVASRVGCREVIADDVTDVIDLLTFGFQADRDRAYWVSAMDRLRQHATPAGYPKYGYLLEVDDVPVGVLLLIFSDRRVGNHVTVRCNGSSLYVVPAFRAYASLLIKRALRYKGVTYLNLTAARHTFPMLAAQGYKPFARGLFIATPALGCAQTAKASVKAATPESCRDERLLSFETDILLDHASYGNVSLLVEHAGQLHPFVFARYHKNCVPMAYLIYCRDQSEFVLFAAPLARFLKTYGYFIVLDANNAIDGVVGKYLAIRPKFWMGAEEPRLSDLPYTEQVMFGF